MRLAAQAKGGFYPTPEKVVDFIATLIRAPAGYYYRNREVMKYGTTPTLGHRSLRCAPHI